MIPPNRAKLFRKLTPERLLFILQMTFLQMICRFSRRVICLRYQNLLLALTGRRILQKYFS